MHLRRTALPLLLLSVFATTSLRAEDLTVLPAETEAGSTKQMLNRYLLEEAFAALDERLQKLEEIETPDECRAYQQRLKADLIQRLGGFPEKTPLHARTVGKLESDYYVIEKVIFESQPQHFVTASFYLPKGQGPFPAVVVPSGHSATAKGADYNQLAAATLARQGIAALAYDPIGQGERNQLLDEAGKPRFNSTTEHTLVGASSIMVGRNTATYRIWDGMRCIDYLCQRPEIDPGKIGATGCSGGGTLSSYLMALDDRVACAAPSCYLTSFRRLLETRGPQDAEQNIFGQIAAGIDHADYMLIRAPKPTLMLTATRDFFDIHGAWNSFRQAKRFYTRLGRPDAVDLVETPTKHGYPQSQRVPMLRWMQRWLADIDQPTEEPELSTFEVSDLQCTPKGQTLLLPGARSVLELNAQASKSFAETRQELWAKENRQQALAEVRKLAGIRPLAKLPEPQVDTAGTEQRMGYRIEKFVLRPEEGLVLPALLFRPEKPSGKRYLYLHGDGKQAVSGADGPIAKLAQQGHLVLTVDLRGSGETGPTKSSIWGGDWDSIFLAYLLGKSMVGMRAEDVLTSARWLSLQGGGSTQPVELIAEGSAAIPALHAAALERELFGKSVEIDVKASAWQDAVADPSAGGDLVNTVHGALRAYDLSDLQTAIAQP